MFRNHKYNVTSNHNGGVLMKKAFGLILGVLLVLCVSTSAMANHNFSVNINPGGLGFSFFDGKLGVSGYLGNGYGYYPSYGQSQYYAPYSYWYQPYAYYYNPYSYYSHNNWGHHKRHYKPYKSHHKKYYKNRGRHNDRSRHNGRHNDRGSRHNGSRGGHSGGSHNGSNHRR